MLTVGDLVPARCRQRPARQLTTAFVRQGHYASEPGIDAIDPPPELSIERIGDLLDHDLSEVLLVVAPARAATMNQEQA